MSIEKRWLAPGRAMSDTSDDVKRRRGKKSNYILFWLAIAMVSCTVGNVFYSHAHASLYGGFYGLQSATNDTPARMRSARRASERANTERSEGPKTKGIDFPSALDERQLDGGSRLTSILRAGALPKTTAEFPIRFRPGELEMDSADALSYCHVDTTKYSGHIKKGPAVLVSLSSRHKLIYRNIPKSSSSSARTAMMDYFKGEDKRMKLDELRRKMRFRNFTLMSFVREPLDRFFSSYDEAFFRFGPWFGTFKNRPMMVKAYHANKHRVDPYPYLYEGLETLKDYRALYCPSEILANKSLNHENECNFYNSVDDGTLRGRFEQFVKDYNGTNPFDVHLVHQVTQLVDSKSGEMLPVTVLYNSSRASAELRSIAKAKGVKIPEDGLEAGRVRKRKFDIGSVSVETKRKICRLMALDYCCLNIELPEVCGGDLEEAPYCKMDFVEERHDKRQLKIRPWDDP